MKNDRRFYVYVHRRKTDGRVFYVGKGCGNRAKTKSGRNSYWKKIVVKHGFVSEIYRGNLTECCAHSIEKMLIASNRVALVNVTDGGEGVSGLVHTDTSKSKMSGPRPNAKAFWSGKPMTDEMKEKFRKAKIGKPQSPEHAAKSRIAKLGKPQPASAREATRLLKSKAIKSSDGVIFSSATDAARKMSERLGLNCSQGNISMAATGLRKTAYGLAWEYIA